jgi:hypothetical protein
MAKYPYMQFYTGDWLKDPSLSMCCASTRGIWIDLLCALHESGRSGIIQGTPEQLSRLCRSTIPEFDQALAELKSTNAADVTERHGVVTVINRRMKKDAIDRADNALRKKRSRVSLQCHSDVTEKSQRYISEVIVHSSETEKEKEPVSLSESSCSRFEKEAFGKTPNDVWKLWKETRKEKSLPAVKDPITRDGIMILADMIDRGDVTLDIISAAMRQFTKKQNDDQKLQTYGLRGFAQNLSRFLPKAAITNCSKSTARRVIYGGKCDCGAYMTCYDDPGKASVRVECANPACKKTVSLQIEKRT